MTRTPNAFTLIELLVSVALGSMVLFIAMSGLRVASQTFSKANQLSLSNSIFRTAVVAANYDLDFWDTFDSRCDLTKQPLREPGFPFYPLDFSTPTTTLAFDHSSPREWYNGHIWSSIYNKASGDCVLKLGDYSIFGKQGMEGDGIVPIEREWRHRILPHITNNIGYYAAVDYLPANFIYAFHDENGVVPEEFGISGYGGPNRRTGIGKFNTGHRERDQPKSKPEMGHSSGYILTTVTGKRDTHPACHRGVFSSSGQPWWDQTCLQDWSRFPTVDFFASQPETWPRVQMRTCVSFFFNRFQHGSQIIIDDPMTGNRIQADVVGLTTTLRGARRQRGLDTEIEDPRYQ